MASVAAPPRPTRPPVDGSRYWSRLLAVPAGAAVVAGLAHLTASLVPAARPLAVPATEFWLFGGLAVWLYLVAAAVTTLSQRRPMPEGGRVLILAAATALGALMLVVAERLPHLAWLGRLGWLVEAAAGLVGLLWLWLRDDRPLMPHEELDELLVPGFRLGEADRKSDRMARAMMVAAQIDLLIGSFYAIRSGDSLWPVHAAFLLLWWGWTVSVALSALTFLLPRVTGRHLVVGQALAGGFILWQGGIWIGFLFGPVFLWLATAGGLLVIGELARLVPGAFRPRPHAVGSRRLGLAVGLRRLMEAGMAGLAVAMVAMPWQLNPVMAAAWASGATSTVLLVLLVHAGAARRQEAVPSGRLALGLGLLALGFLVVPWTAWSEAAGGALSAAGGLVTLWVLARQGPDRAHLQAVTGGHGA